MFLQTRQPTEALQWSGVTGRVRCGNRSSLLRFDFRDKNNHNQQCMKKNKKKFLLCAAPKSLFVGLRDTADLRGLFGCFQDHAGLGKARFMLGTGVLVCAWKRLSPGTEQGSKEASLWELLYSPTPAGTNLVATGKEKKKRCHFSLGTCFWLCP